MAGRAGDGAVDRQSGIAEKRAPERDRGRVARDAIRRILPRRRRPGAVRQDARTSRSGKRQDAGRLRRCAEREQRDERARGQAASHPALASLDAHRAGEPLGSTVAADDVEDQVPAARHVEHQAVGPIARRRATP